jgi:phosphatidate cytidylyltransferase
LTAVIEIGPASSRRKTEGPLPALPHNLMRRIASAAVMAPAALVVAWLGDWPFAVFWGVAAIVVLWEWTHLAESPRSPWALAPGIAALVLAVLAGARQQPLAAIAAVGLAMAANSVFGAGGRRRWAAAGAGYAGCMLLAPLLLRADADYGLAAILLLFAVVWSTDICAYFVGRALGGPRLAPKISPKKTWSGAVGGAVGAVAAALTVASLLEPFDRLAIAVVALLLSVMAQGGDLLESSIKRHFGAKDASHIIPGHGGVMDRLDGFWAAAVAGCLLGLMRGGFDHAARGLLIW